MKNRMGIIVLILICVALSVALVWAQRRAALRKLADAESIGNYSNKWVETDARLVQVRQVNTSLETDLKEQRDAFVELTNAFTRTVADLEKIEADLKSTREEVAKRDARINDLESQNEALDERALDLSDAITNLTAQIDDTRRKLAASEGDKAFLEKELQRLMAEKAELERQFNDLALLRAQVARLKEELNISRRLEWIRKGLFAKADQKGAQQLMEKSWPAASQANGQSAYDLNVEVSSDGSVKVVPPSTNRPAANPASSPSPTP